LGSAFFITNVDRFTEICGPFTYTLWTEPWLRNEVPGTIFSYTSAQLDDIVIPFRFGDWEVATLKIYTANKDILQTANHETYEKKHRIYVRKILSVFWEQIDFV
jgi:hypothetical protein